MKKKLIIFIPSIEGGGVEKNLYIISNYLAKKLNKISIISSSLKNPGSKIIFLNENLKNDYEKRFKLNNNYVILQN